MMQIGFVDYHDARIIERCFVTEVVMHVVADLVERHVKIGGRETGRPGGEHFDFRECL